MFTHTEVLGAFEGKGRGLGPSRGMCWTMRARRGCT